ncbi:hypothetical protein LIER_39442 [Lithospermum erythrorhizon]|uniref:Reverse transcriptase n=1 Tax=Lithospermum erythrorhizon TaxID=34254 RepID=A0AAV3QK82_LITER
MDNFRQVVHDCELIDLGYMGYQFTWCNNFVSPNCTRARLDRSLHYWNTVGETLCNMALNFLNNGSFLRKFNFTLITSVPKVDRPISMSQFRPIALCNTAAKVMAKPLSIRLKRFFLKVISETQSAFVPNRLITDKILLAYEAHHVIKHKKHGKDGYMSIKLNMLKSYDCIK